MTWVSTRSAHEAAPGARLGGGPRRSVRAWIALVLLVPQLTGCFHYVPVAPVSVPAGAEVAVVVTDRGRVALADALGPGLRRMEGRLLQQTDTSVVLAVSTLEFLDLGVPMRWQGESVELSREHILELRERRLSRSRSWVAAGLIAVAAIAISLIAITGFGGDDLPDRPGGPGNGETS